jgi:uncharacterized membrane protein YhaH (DUF805 family)
MVKISIHLQNATILCWPFLHDVSFNMYFMILAMILKLIFFFIKIGILLTFLNEFIRFCCESQCYCCGEDSE